MWWIKRDESLTFPRDRLAAMRDAGVFVLTLAQMFKVWRVDPAHIMAWRYPHTGNCICVPCTIDDPIKQMYCDEGGGG